MRLVSKRRLPPNCSLIYPDGTPKPFLVDSRFVRRLRRIRWRYLPVKKRARGFFGKTRTRQYLHRYVLMLAKKYYPEVTFANGDPFDCRLINLKPYRREEEGAMRQLFKNSSTRRKGVTFNKRTRTWAAMIRTRGKLRHLGYYPDADSAANVYAEAWNLAHPTLPPMPVRGRT